MKILITLLLTALLLSGLGSRSRVVSAFAFSVRAADGAGGGESIRPTPVNDFDGDGATDFAVARSEETVPGEYHLIWYILRSSDQSPDYKWFGLASDQLVTADYDGDGITEAAVFRGGQWYVQKPDNSFTWAQVGEPGDLPVPADYDGDGKADFAVYQPEAKRWAVWQSLSNSAATYTFDCAVCSELANLEYEPVPADYDGDGRADYTLVQVRSDSKTRQMIIKNSSLYLGNGEEAKVLYLDVSSDPGAGSEIGDGREIDRPIRRDFNRDGRMDLALVRRASPTSTALKWFIYFSVGEQPGGATLQPNYVIHWGQCGDYPVAGDYDNNGFIDLAVWRPDSGVFYVRPTLNENLDGGQMVTYQWGLPTDTPTLQGSMQSCQH